ncbi:MAG: hypothetical protein CM15mP120_20030 [Pseudomonadota bacterium]|nr:MAG: hypothetical protein CM15mP120_20030 [Pseudomonadota bacterium]
MPLPAPIHVFNNVGGVGVNTCREAIKKPLGALSLPALDVPWANYLWRSLGVSRGFLNGWYAHNGALSNPRLGFVCVSEEMTGEFGLCGYFKEYAHDLSADERLQFAKDELPPPFDADAQPLCQRISGMNCG